jgi:transposase
MALYFNTLIEIPDDSSVHIKSYKGSLYQYVYKYTRHYRNEEGKPRHDSTIIGKYDPPTGKMYPNKNFYTFFPLENISGDIYTFEFGLNFLICQITDELGLTNILVKNFGAKALDILIIATYIVINGTVIDGIEEWMEKSFFPFNHSNLTSQKCSKIFENLTPTVRHIFFKEWVRHKSAGKKIYYDVTSISSYSDEMIDVEFGYNRDNEDLPQYNIGMFCERESGLPIYYDRYNGSINDKTNFPYVLENAKSVGIFDFDIIMDAGFWSSKSFNRAREICNSFIIGMPLHLKEARKAQLENQHIANDFNYHLEEYDITGTSVNATIHGVDGRILLYYDKAINSEKSTLLFNALKKEKEELSLITKYSSVDIKKYSEHFIINKHENDDMFDFSIDAKKINALLNMKGYFAFFTNDMDSSLDQILKLYRQKDMIEKLFAQVKVEMYGNRFHTKKEQTTDGKVFITFIGSIIRSYLIQKLSQYSSAENLSLKRIFAKLANITITLENNEFRLSKALTKNQRDILSIFNLTDEITKKIRYINENNIQKA